MSGDQEYRTLTADQAGAILAAGAFDDFKGVLEDEHLDFKTSPYPLAAGHAVQEKAKRDLVEDVVKFANVDGGILVLGVETERLEVQPTEVGRVIHPFPESAMDIGQYHAIISERVR